MTPILLVVAALYVLHQDIWFWTTARPLVFGFLPIGLFYHAAYTALISLLLLWLVRTRWPAHLDAEAGDAAPHDATHDAGADHLTQK